MSQHEWNRMIQVHVRTYDHVLLGDGSKDIDCTPKTGCGMPLSKAEYTAEHPDHISCIDCLFWLEDRLVKRREEFNRDKRLHLNPAMQWATGSPSRHPSNLISIDSYSVIASAGSLRISVQPMMLFRIERLLVNKDIAKYFTIDQLMVGKQQVALFSGAIPATIFDGTVPIWLECPTLQVSQSIALDVVNIGIEPIRFMGAYVGKMVR